MATSPGSQTTVHPRMPGSTDHSAAASAWNPLRHSLFRALWIASVVSTTGTLMQDVGAAWLMTSLAPSPLMVALMQTAASLPVFLFALPAGALADTLDRRRLLLCSLGAMSVVAVILGALTLTGVILPWALLTLTFMMGVGATISTPASQANLPELVPHADIPTAITLNSVGVNIARAIGPVLGGLLVARGGAGVVFLLNALSFLGLIVILYRWHRAPRKSSLPRERITSAVVAGARYVRYSPPFRAALVRAGAFFVCGSAVFALLPLLARRELGLSSAGYGALMGCVGVGAIAGASVLPRLHRMVSTDLLVAGMTVVMAAVAVALAYVRDFGALCAVMLAGGVAWITLMSSFAVAAGSAVSPWVKARALATYIVVFQGGIALGSVIWGEVATRTEIPTALLYAAGGMMVGLPLAFRYQLSKGEGLNLQPSMSWPAPQVASEPGLERGPVMVTVEYRIDPARAADFERAMGEVELERRRDGAFFWGLFVDAAEPGRCVEFFTVESWVEHLRQHERVSITDQDLQEQARVFHIGSEPPVVSHFVAEHGPR